MKPTEFRPATFVNKDTLTESFGIKALFKNRWMPLGSNGEPTLFPTEAERDSKLTELKKGQEVKS